MKNELENLRFNLTPKIQDLIVEMLIIKQMLEDEKLEAEKNRPFEKTPRTIKTRICNRV